jgi:hypothetical protein
MRLSWALLLAGLGVATPVLADCPKVTLELKLKKAESGLMVDATLKNGGATAIELMKTGDGSSFGKRNPRLTFTLSPDDIKEVGTCGFINALADEDFLTLKPGQSQPLGSVHPPTPGKPGKYTLTVTYKNDPAAEPIGSGAPHPPTPAQLSRIAKMAQCEVTSAPLQFTWDGKRARK